VHVGIKDGKIWDICSNLKNKRDDSIADEDYVTINKSDIRIGDTWLNGESLKDAPSRLPVKSVMDLKIEE